MNKIENLLVSVSEECSEIQKAVSKALRFGLDEHYNTDPTNAEEIIHEYYDLTALIHLLQYEDALPRLSPEEMERTIIAKLQKVEHYQNVSRELGNLKED